MFLSSLSKTFFDSCRDDQTFLDGSLASIPRYFEVNLWCAFNGIFAEDFAKRICCKFAGTFDCLKMCPDIVQNSVLASHSRVSKRVRFKVSELEPKI